MQRLLFGTDEPQARTLSLRAGRLTVLLRGAKLAAVELDGHEVWHGVAFLYRDPDWGTPEPVVDRLEHATLTNGFEARIHGHIPAGPGIDFEIGIKGADGVLRYEVTAVPRGDIASNRTGLCVMHPLSACGRRVEVEHTDGRVSRSTFPTLIAPWPPFTLVRGIRHEFAEDAWARCRFEGDDFELEDQRNNADASFKTYSRSNLMLRPYTLRAGVPMRQSVKLCLEPSRSGFKPIEDRPVTVRVGEPAGMLPRIGVAIAPADAAAPREVRSAARTLAPAMLHLSLDAPTQPTDWPAIAQLLAECGAQLRLDIEGVTIGKADAELAALAAHLHRAGVEPESVAVFPSAQPAIDAARRAFPVSAIGGGTPHFFTQLNRIEDLGRADFLSFTTASVVHGADDDAVMAGLQSLPAMISTLRAQHGDVPVRVGPSSIGARKSPLGAQPASDGSRRLALARRDPRTGGLFGAAWMLGYVAQFARAGVDAVSVMSLQGDAALVELRGSTAVRHPAFHVLMRLRSPARMREVSSSHPHRVAALVLDRKGAGELLLANLTAEPLEVRIDGWRGGGDAAVMDLQALQDHARQACPEPWRCLEAPSSGLRLGPYAVARL